MSDINLFDVRHMQLITFCYKVRKQVINEYNNCETLMFTSINFISRLTKIK